MARISPVPGSKWIEAEDNLLIEARLTARAGTTNAAIARMVAPRVRHTEDAVKKRLYRLKERIDEALYQREMAAIGKCPRFGKPRKISSRGVRKCLCCGRKFQSEGAHNRLCNGCRTKDVSPYAPSGS